VNSNVRTGSTPVSATKKNLGFPRKTNENKGSTPLLSHSGLCHTMSTIDTKGQEILRLMLLSVDFAVSTQRILKTRQRPRQPYG